MSGLAWLFNPFSCRWKVVWLSCMQVCDICVLFCGRQVAFVNSPNWSCVGCVCLYVIEPPAITYCAKSVQTVEILRACDRFCGSLYVIIIAIWFIEYSVCLKSCAILVYNWEWYIRWTLQITGLGIIAHQCATSIKYHPIS